MTNEKKEITPTTTFDGVLMGQRFIYRLTACVKFLPDTNTDQNFYEALQRFERHVKEFSFSRGEINFTIEELERFEQAQEEDNKKVEVKKKEEEAFNKESAKIEAHRKELEKDSEPEGGYCGGEDN